MGEMILQVDGISKQYRETKALDHVTVSLERGKIYGFIGLNGAGKTTFMRIVMGLAFPTGGWMRLFGAADQNALAEQRKRIGCLVEEPALFPDMNARENLEAFRLCRGIQDRRCVENALELVRLTDTGRKKARHFSQGMKKRLGIACALLSEPEFLVLDEPNNGLDPISIVEIRQLLQKLNREKRTTILLSSHILDEARHLATNYIFIHKGRIVEEITADELDEKCRSHISIASDNTPLALTVLEKQLGITRFTVMPDNSISLYERLDDVASVSRALTENGLLLTRIGVFGDSLEHYFINLLGGGGL